jgi:hypothetical protein
MEELELSMIVVVDGRSFEVTTNQQTARSMSLSVVADGRGQWSFEVAGWRPWSCGVSGGLFYLWAARQLILFPKLLADEPAEIEFDEDLLLVLKLDPGWVFVCETSVRLSAGYSEMARIELDEAIESSRWEHDHLVVCNTSGQEISIAVGINDLEVVPDS